MTAVALNEATNIANYGGKAANLGKMIQAGLPVPVGIAVGLDAFSGDGTLTDEAKQSVRQFLDDSKLYAVRSSALAEDAEGASWAGQFETFLNTKAADVIAKVEECHNSTKARAKAYAREQSGSGQFEIAVVIQEMLKPQYAGVLFTQDPVTGEDHLVTEYVAGLGEELVSGKADPKRLVLTDDTGDAPFDTAQLADLAAKVERLFGTPQDIEWAWTNDQMWLVQARPITATGDRRKGYYLGEPDELFYWGPSRATPLYMGDFMAAVERVFIDMAEDPDMPTPPKSLVLFYDGKMVWLSNAHEFGTFTEKTFAAYQKRRQLDKDIISWRAATQRLPALTGVAFDKELVNAWRYTELAEFSLYGAESFITKQLHRFDERTLPEIWGAFSLSDKPTFLNALDSELAQSGDAAAMAKKYPWIRNGYAGPNDEALWYFEKRLEAIEHGDLFEQENNELKRQAMIAEYHLTDQEVSMMALARRLAEFMDERKEWMMQTRRLITRPVTNIEHGWYFADGKAALVGEADTRELWQRYVDFKSAAGVVTGIVANTGGRHFVSGEVAVLNSHVDPVENDKILVVPSTSPGWVPLMRHARALVTDHGGMMSHAAIVAREFNLPCIVGTKQGTKMLQTGDKVVLDLVKGEINK